MKQARPFAVNALISGLITVVPYTSPSYCFLTRWGRWWASLSPFAWLLPTRIGREASSCLVRLGRRSDYDIVRRARSHAVERDSAASCSSCLTNPRWSCLPMHEVALCRALPA